MQTFSSTFSRSTIVWDIALLLQLTVLKLVNFGPNRATAVARDMLISLQTSGLEPRPGKND
jgi:hypothetical protein